MWQGIGASLGESLTPFAFFYLPSTTSDDGADPDAEKLTTDSLGAKTPVLCTLIFALYSNTLLYSLPHRELTHSFGVTTLCPQDCYIAAE